MIQILQNEATAVRRRVYFQCVNATDGMTPEIGEEGGQPQISYAGAEAFSDTGIGTLVHMGNGRYYAELVDSVCQNANYTVIESRYKSDNTAETLGTPAQIIPDTNTAVGDLPRLINVNTCILINNRVYNRNQTEGLKMFFALIDVNTSSTFLPDTGVLAFVDVSLNSGVDFNIVDMDLYSAPGYDFTIELTPTGISVLDALPSGILSFSYLFSHTISGYLMSGQCYINNKADLAKDTTVAKEATLLAVSGQVKDLHDEAFGRWTIDTTGNTLTLYKVNGTVLKVFDLTVAPFNAIKPFKERIPR